VHIFLLNDCLLIATKKKRQASKDAPKVKLVADRCFSLEDITLIDMKDTEGLYKIKLLFINNISLIKSGILLAFYQSK
jgi:hypothetical protein